MEAVEMVAVVVEAGVTVIMIMMKIISMTVIMKVEQR